MPAWRAGSWAADAWAGTAWDESEPPAAGTAWFSTAWASGSWREGAWTVGAPVGPTIVSIVPGETSAVVTHSNGGTHYRLTTPVGGTPGAWVALGTSPVTITGLTANTEYTLDISDDESTVADSENFGTENPGSGGGEIDPTPPPSPAVLTSATTASITSSGAVVGCTTDIATGTLYVAVTTSATAPSAAAIEAGTGFAAAGSQLITSTGAKTRAVSGLLASTVYYHHHLHKSVGGDSNILTSASFTTAAPPPPAPATVTIRLVDAAVSGAALPDLAAIQWAWWDDAADESETWGVMPTASGTAESTNEAGALQLEATSTKSSGQTVLIKLYQHGYPPRAFTGLLTVD